MDSDRWSYVEPRPHAWLPAAAALCAAAGILALTGPSTHASPAVLILAGGSLLLAGRIVRRRTVDIDRSKGSIVLKDRGALWTAHRHHVLADFDQVAVWERRSPVDAGYFVSRFIIVLLGCSGPLPLLTTDDEREAAKIRGEVAALLRALPSGKGGCA